MVLGAILLIAGAFGATGLAGSAALNADHTYHGCFQSNGNVYLTGESGLNTGCRTNDTAFAFNMQGQVGPVGPQGPQGIQGLVGAHGLQRPPEPQGIQGLTGVAGANGKDGADGAPGKDGTNGTNGVSVVASVLPSGDAHCATGGVQLSVGTSNTFVCNGVRGPEGPQGPAGSSSSGPAADSYAGNYVLTIDGSIVGGVHLIDGCALAGSVVTHTVSGVSVKDLGNATYEPCTFEFGANATSALWDWFAATFSGTTVRHSFEFIRTGSGPLAPEISCQHALMTELSVPDLSPGSSSTFLLTAQVAPEQCASSTSGGLLSNTQVTPFASSDVSVSLANVTGGPSSLDGFTISQTIAAGTVGADRISTVEPGPVQIPNLTLHYRASDTASVTDLQDWFHSFVFQGNTEAANRFPLTVSLASGAKVITFNDTGISRLDPEERASDSAYRADVFPDGVAISG